MSSKDKQKVIGEELDQTKIERFLQMETYGQQNPDFHILVKAYRGLPAEAFDQFLGAFVSQSRNINATDEKGSSLLSQVEQHKNQQGYSTALKKHGAH